MVRSQELSMTHYLVQGSRYITALLFIVFGLNGLFGFFSPPPIEVEAAKSFLSGLASSGYFIPFLKVSEILGGLMLLSEFFLPLGLLILAPIVINIFLFHLFAAGGLQGMESGIVALMVIVAWGYKKRFASLFQSK
jgi:putative oxidoreductase